MANPLTETRKGEAALDKWSVVHFISGAALALLQPGFLTAAMVLVGYEAFEMQLRKEPDGDDENASEFTKGLLEYESPKNIVADIVVGLAGYALAVLFLRGFFNRK
jgi:hypothetical protein